jgi:hypothetical protein
MELYKRFSSSKTPGKPVSMEADELVQLCTDSEGLISEGGLS